MPRPSSAAGLLCCLCIRTSRPQLSKVMSLIICSVRGTDIIPNCTPRGYKNAPATTSWHPPSTLIICSIHRTEPRLREHREASSPRTPRTAPHLAGSRGTRAQMSASRVATSRLPGFAVTLTSVYIPHRTPITTPSPHLHKPAALRAPAARRIEERLLADADDAEALARRGAVVVRRGVERAPVVPQRDVVRAPAVAHLPRALASARRR